MTWTIKNVPAETRQIIKAYAAKNGLSIAEALSLIAKGIEL